MKHLSKLLAIAAFALTASSFSNQAHAEMGIRLDNYATGDVHASFAKTTNQVTVCVRFYSVFNPVCSSLGSRVLNATGNHDFLWNGIETWADAKRVEVSINGGDMFWIDQIELLNGQRQVVDNEGIDNTQGYCISTQSSDSSQYCSPTNATLRKLWDI